MTIDQELKEEIRELATISQAIKDIEFIKEKINSSESSLGLLIKMEEKEKINKLSRALLKMVINKFEKFN